MRFLYTGAIAYLQPQNNPAMSLGGFVSSSIIPNSRLNSLFSDGSYYSNQQGLIETKGVILENETSNNLTDLTIGYTYAGADSGIDFKIEIAVVTLTSNQFIEKIGNSFDTPYTGDFVEANIDVDNSIDNTASIGDMPANSRFGIWIRRTLITKTFLATDYNNTNNQISDIVYFKLNWNINS